MVEQSLYGSALSICIGVTGHRFLEESDVLVRSVDGVLDQVEARFSGVQLSVISALAEGSDRLVARRVLERPGARLIVPLPMPEQEYMQDFQQEASAREFLDLLVQADRVVRFPRAPTRPAAYAVAGQYLIDNCDLLVALWDGAPSQGDGGTGSVVAAARRAGLPIFWIYTYNRKPDGPASAMLTPQGGVVIENSDRFDA